MSCLKFCLIQKELIISLLFAVQFYYIAVLVKVILYHTHSVQSSVFHSSAQTCALRGAAAHRGRCGLL